MKEKLVGSLGLFGYLLWIVVGLLYVIAPVVMLDLPFWVTFILLFAINSLPLIGTLINIVLYIWAFFVTLGGPQDVVAVVFYVLFALFVITELIPILSALFSRDR
jgi:hypothetical protein